MRAAAWAGLLVAAALAATPTALAEAEYQLFYSERASRFVADGTAAEGETRGYRFVILEPNVTRVEFVLTWHDEGDRAGLSGPDVFHLTAQDPDGRPLGAGERSATGEARLEARVNHVPADGPVAGEDLDARMAESTARDGTGEWRAWVKLEDAGNPEGARVDAGNAFRLVAIIHHYEGVPMRVVTLGQPVAAREALDAPLGWTLAVTGLTALAAGLAVAIALQARRRRRGLLSPNGENTPSPGR